MCHHITLDTLEVIDLLEVVEFLLQHLEDDPPTSPCCYCGDDLNDLRIHVEQLARRLSNELLAAEAFP